ncbi:Crp/Fnr family transcriptional regulator [Candidatus Bipolaricaulota bacterium]
MDGKDVQRISDVDKVLSILKGTPIFRRATDDDLRAMLKTAIQRVDPAGAMIVEEGKEGLGFYLIISGEADVSKRGIPLATLGAGSFFGELSCIDGASRTADVVAASETTCVVIPQWEMNSALESIPGVAQGMFRELVRRLRVSNAALDAL